MTYGKKNHSNLLHDYNFKFLKKPEYLDIKNTIYCMVFFSRFEERADTGRGFADDQVSRDLFFFLRTHGLPSG